MFSWEHAPVFAILLCISVLTFKKQAYQNNENIVKLKFPSYQTDSVKKISPTPSAKPCKSSEIIKIERQVYAEPLGTYKTVTYNFSYKPVTFKIKHKGPLIITFTDTKYWPAAQIWIARMKTLGYSNFKVFSLGKCHNSSWHYFLWQT